MHYTFHHIPKTGGSTLRIRLEDRADKKQISKLDYAIGHNTTKRTPGTHFIWLRDPLDRDISQFNYDISKDEAEADTFEDTCRLLAGNFSTLWLYKNYLLHDPNRSDTDYKKYADKKDLSKEFIEWHKSYNGYDYKLFQEFCT